MTEYEHAQLGQFETVKTWALYFVPASNPGTHTADPLYQLVHEDKPVVVGLLAEDDSGNVCRHCHRCLHCANEGQVGACPGLDAHARVAQRREQERRPGEVIEIAELEVPKYLNLGGRIREVVERLNATVANPMSHEDD